MIKGILLFGDLYWGSRIFESPHISLMKPAEYARCTAQADRQNEAQFASKQFCAQCLLLPLLGGLGLRV